MDIKQYLRAVAELEQIIYTLDKAIGNLNNGKRYLGISKNFPKPEELIDNDLKCDSKDFAIGACVYVGIPMGFICSIFTCGIEGFSMSLVICTIIVVSVIVSIIGGFIGRIFESIEEDNLIKKYKEKFIEYKKLVDSDRLRVKKELEKKYNIDLQIEALNQKKIEIASTLNKLYGMNIIYPKYRNFIAVTTFYEYFNSGICSVLEGHEGAYNKYEIEIRLNAIIYKLDDIIGRLDKIRLRQYELYNAICAGNRIAENIYNQSIKGSEVINNISDNIAIIAYSNEVAAKNTEILKQFLS